MCTFGKSKLLLDSPFSLAVQICLGRKIWVLFNSLTAAFCKHWLVSRARNVMFGTVPISTNLLALHARRVASARAHDLSFVAPSGG